MRKIISTSFLGVPLTALGWGASEVDVFNLGPSGGIETYMAVEDMSATFDRGVWQFEVCTTACADQELVPREDRWDENISGEIVNAVRIRDLYPMELARLEVFTHGEVALGTRMDPM